jgi:hypothetical protein
MNGYCIKMYDDPIIRSLELLRRDAKANGQLLLSLCYARSECRRRDVRVMALEEIRDEVMIALAMRRPPVFGFIAPEKVCEVQSIKPASTELQGSLNDVVALIGG